MNLADRAKLSWNIFRGKVSASGWTPRTGAKGYHLFDGSKFKGSLYYPSAFSLNSAALRDRSRVAYWDSTQARAIISRLVDNTIGTGLSLESNPMWQYLSGVGEDARHDFSRDIENRFHLWANSRDADAAGKSTFYDLQALALLNQLRDGECFLILRYMESGKRLSPLSIQQFQK
jgi:capsid protein